MFAEKKESYRECVREFCVDDRGLLQRRSRAGELPGCGVRGPLSFDLAYEAEAAATVSGHLNG